MAKNDRKNIPSADWVLQQLRNDPAYMAQNAEKERQRDIHLEEIQRISEPILLEINQQGLSFSSIHEIRSSGVNYSAAIPVLLKWLPVIQHIGLYQSLVATLAVRWAKPAAAIPLIIEFRNFRFTGRRSDAAKWGIANALSFVADESVFEEITELLRDGRHGIAREMLVYGLKNMKKEPRAIEVLIEMLDDPIVGRHALAVLRKSKDPRAKSAPGYVPSAPAGADRVKREE